MNKQIGDLDVSYEVEGDGPPLLLLHGGGADMVSWEELVPLLRDDFTVYRYDLRGFGKTRRPPSPALSLALWTEDLLAFLDAFELRDPALAGWSLGGNDSANVFGSAVGSRMVRFTTAAIICGIFVFLCVLACWGCSQ